LASDEIMNAAAAARHLDLETALSHVIQHGELVVNRATL
jgi:hypothetical protein